MAVAVRPIPLGNCSYQGLNFGPGEKIQVVDHDGFEETPALRTNDQDRAAADGQWSGKDYKSGRIATITFTILGDDNLDLRTQLAAFVRIFRPDSTEYPLWLYDSQRFLKARVRKRGIPRQERGGRGSTAWCAVQFYAKDPYYYGPTASVTAGLISTVPGSGGLSMPLTFPLRFGTTLAGAGSGNAFNAGDEPTPVRLYIPGPCVNPVVSSDTAARSLEFNITLASGEFLVTDSDMRTVLLNGTAYRNAVIDGRNWFDLLPSDNFLRYSSASRGSGEHAVATWNPRWQ